MVSMPARRRHVDTDVFLGMVARIVAAAGKRVAAADADDLVALLELRVQLDEAIVSAVAGLRANGTTWEEIGEAAGTTRQAAIMRWGPKI
jgi:hypothetical protein